MNDLSTMLCALGLPDVAPEPEVVAKVLGNVQAKSLAGIIAKLVNENEPLLRARAYGRTVTVRERGGDAVMHFTIESTSNRDSRAAEKAAGENQ